MTIGLFIYARNDSTRLPHKHLLKFGEDCVLGIIIERLRVIRGDIRLILLTTERSVDDPLVEFVRLNNLCEVFRGDHLNVSKRTLDAINHYNFSAFVRINGDCPLVDSRLIEQGLMLFDKETKFLTNIWPTRSYPYGISLEIINAKFYSKYFRHCNQFEKEHVTSHLYRLLDLGLLNTDSEVKSITSKVDLSNYRFVLDTPEDFKQLTNLFHSHSPITASYEELCNVEHYKRLV